MIICPSCGSNVKGDLCLGCPSCGARAVGPPLARAEHELPSFGRASLAFVNGVVMSGGFLGLLVVALVEFKSSWFRFGTIVAAGEAAAWQLKWVALPVAGAVLWSGARIVRSIKQEPSRFVGLRAARVGFSASAVVALLIATLIGVTIPVRLERRQWAIEAAWAARGRTIDRALVEYRAVHGTLPANDDLVKELRTVPDPDGSIADALRYVDSNGYQASTVLASSKGKPLAVRGGALRDSPANAGLATDHAVMSFTNYELHLPGEDKILNTDDDLIVRDGVVMTFAEYQSYLSSHARVP